MKFKWVLNELKEYREIQKRKGNKRKGKEKENNRKEKDACSINEFESEFIRRREEGKQLVRYII